MDVDDEGFRLDPFYVPDYAKQRRSSDDALREMQQRLLSAVKQSIDDSAKKPQPVEAQKLQLRPETPQMRNVANTNISPYVNPMMIGQAQAEMTAEQLKELIYAIRDEWSAETGEWDGSKIPVNILAEKLVKRIKSYQRPEWK